MNFFNKKPEVHDWLKNQLTGVVLRGATSRRAGAIQGPPRQRGAPQQQGVEGGLGEAHLPQLLHEGGHRVRRGRGRGRGRRGGPGAAVAVRRRGPPLAEPFSFFWLRDSHFRIRAGVGHAT